MSSTVSKRSGGGVPGFRRVFRGSAVTVVSGVVLVTMVGLSLAAPWVAPQDPYDLATLDILDAELPPFWLPGGDPRFVFGTDHQGRDLLSTILYGLRLSLMIGFFAVVLQVLIGVSVGLVAGYFGGVVDGLLMRLADIQMSFSTLMVAIVASALFQIAFGPERYGQLAVVMLIVVIGLAEWPQYARTVRAAVLAEKSKEYVDAVRVLGLPAWRIMIGHILPNSLSPLFVLSTVQVANAVVSEAALSFLGLGMPPSTPSLGSLIHSGFEYIFSGSWWITVIPGIVLVTLILVINLLGDSLHDALNPRLSRGEGGR